MLEDEALARSLAHMSGGSNKIKKADYIDIKNLYLHNKDPNRLLL